MSVFPKTYRARQGKRAADRYGPCKECGYPARLRCSSCESWRCRECAVFRQVPGRVGIYSCRCYPRCRKRMRPEVVELVKRVTR